MMDTTFLDLRINYMDIMEHTYIYIPGSTNNHIQPQVYTLPAQPPPSQCCAWKCRTPMNRNRNGRFF